MSSKRILDFPLFGHIQDMPVGLAGLKTVNKYKSQLKFSRIKGNCFATNGTFLKSNKESRSSCSVLKGHDSLLENQRHVCVLHWNHSLEECPQRKGKKDRDTILFPMEKRICWCGARLWC